MNPALVKQVSASQLADILEVNKPDITNFVKKGMPRIPGENQKAHRFDVDECKAWYYEYRNQKHDERQDSLRDAQIRKLNLESDRIELELAERRKEIIEISRIAAIWSNLMTELKTNLLVIPKNLGALFDSIKDGFELEQLSATLIGDALNELSRSEHLIEEAIKDK